MIDGIKKVTVIAPHPDDETLGAGGTIAKLANLGAEVSILVVSGHLPPLYPVESYERTEAEARKAFELLGAANYEFLKIPATMIHEEPVARLNGLVSEFVKSTEPEVVFIPFPDRHIDHRIVFDAAMVATRPVQKLSPKLVLAYETLSETHWNAPGIEPSFTPEVFVNISSTIETKCSAVETFSSQVSGVPARSVDACRALARFRGSYSACDYAEAFKVIRMLL